MLKVEHSIVAKQLVSPMQHFFSTQVSDDLKGDLGSAHSDNLDTMQLLALPLLEQQRYAEAETMLKQEYGLQKKILSLEHLDILKCMFFHAELLGVQEKYAEADKLGGKVYNTRKKQLGLDK
jgi:hypothetical protein